MSSHTVRVPVDQLRTLLDAAHGGFTLDLGDGLPAQCEECCAEATEEHADDCSVAQAFNALSALCADAEVR